MHQTASTREVDPEDTHPPTARMAPKDRPLARMASRTLLIRPHPEAGATASRTGDLIATDPGLQPGGRPLPVATGDQQGAALLPRPGHHRPRPAGRHRPATQAEHHQIHAIHQHGGHLDRIGTGFGDDRDPAQIRAHFDGRQQADVGLADDRGVPALRRHRRHHAQRQRPGARQHRHRPARQRRWQQFGQRFGQRQQRFRVRQRVHRRRWAPRRPPPTLPDTAAILRRRCSTCSARSSRRCSRLMATVTAAPPASSEPLYFRMYVR